VLVVLLLGVTTDYSVFFLAGMRSRLADGLSRVPAARRTTAEYTPIIVTAGFVVAAGIASLALARVSTLQAFGPALALTVLIAMMVAVTLAPALIAIFGGLLFRGMPAPARRPRPGGTWRDGAVRLVTIRPVAALTVVVCVVVLAVGAWGLGLLRLGFPLVSSLPGSAQAARAQAAASKGFAPGILSPTEILVIGPGVTRRQGQTAQPQPADLVADANQEPPAAQPGPAAPRNLGLERQSDADQPGPAAPRNLGLERQSDADAGELAGRQRPGRAADD
jgi:RND superfamily putative drug exporter